MSRPASYSVTVEVHGLERIRSRLSGQPPGERLWANPWRKVMSDVREAAEGAAVLGGPIRTGRLVRSIKATMDRSPHPRWVQVSVKAKASSRKYRDYPYPRRLEFEAKNPRYQWLKRSMSVISGPIQQYLARMAREIEANW